MEEQPPYTTPPPSTLGLIRLGYLGLDPTNLVDMDSRLNPDTKTLTLSSGGNNFPQDQMAVKRRIWQDLTRQEDWKGQDILIALLRFPANYPLTYICRRLRKTSWTVTKELNKPPELKIWQTDYTDVSCNVPHLQRC